MSRLDCQHCGQRVEIPPDHSRPKLRCPHCGYYVEVPESLRNAAPVEEPILVPDTPKKKKPKLEAPPLLAGSEADDDNPYNVPGDPIKKCTACRKEIELDATFCIHCGIDFASGKKAKKTFEIIDRSWEPRWNYDVRFKAFAVLALINGVLATIAVIGGGSFINGLLFIIMQGGLQAFLLGTYEKLTVRRTGKGGTTLWRTWRVAFLARLPQKIEWKASQGVGVIAFHHPGVLEWVTFIYLILCGIVPGIVFWWFVMRPDRFHISLCDVYGSTNDIAFRTTDREQAEEIGRTINDATGLWYKPVL